MTFHLRISAPNLLNWLLFSVSYGAELVGIEHAAVDDLVDRPKLDRRRAPNGSQKTMQQIVTNLEMVVDLENSYEVNRRYVEGSEYLTQLELWEGRAHNHVIAGNATRWSGYWRGPSWWAYRALAEIFRILHARAVDDERADVTLTHYLDTTEAVLLDLGESIQPLHPELPGAGQHAS